MNSLDIIIFKVWSIRIKNNIGMIKNLNRLINLTSLQFLLYPSLKQKIYHFSELWRSRCSLSWTEAIRSIGVFNGNTHKIMAFYHVHDSSTIPTCRISPINEFFCFLSRIFSTGQSDTCLRFVLFNLKFAYSNNSWRRFSHSCAISFISSSGTISWRS